MQEKLTMESSIMIKVFTDLQADQTVKRLPAMREIWVWSLCGEDPLKKEMATPIFSPGKSHGQRSLAGYSPWDHKEMDTTEQIYT